MDYTWIKTYCETKTGAVVDFKIEWNAERYLVDDKMFGLRGEDNNKRPIITLKLIPEHGQMLRELYPDQVVPGYYANKLHWNSIYLDTEVSIDFLKPLIDEAYTLIFNNLPKKKQLALIEGEDK